LVISTTHTAQFPDFLVAGVAKAGTTHLYEVLKQHSKLFLPEKESFYFNRIELLQLGKGEINNPYKGLVRTKENYAALFSNCPKDHISGEVGTGYFYDYLHAIPRIKKTAGDPKIIVLLRHPVSRCYSGYMHFVKNAMESLSFEEALKAEKSRISNGFSFMWHYQELSKYALAAEAYLKNFSRVKFLFFEQMVQTPDDFYKELFDFLELPIEPFSHARTNASGKPKSKALQGLVTRPNPIKHGLRPLFRAIVPEEKRKGVREWFKNKNLGKSDDMFPETRAMLNNYFADDIEQLEKVLQRKITYWTP